MSAAARRGRFISFEGGEASGKSLQAQRLAAALRARGLDVVLVREPGGTPAGERIREILLHTREVALSPEAQALLFTAARAQLVREVIRPALERGAVVVADRYFDSTIAYQGSGLGADPEGLRAITSFAVGDTIPERTFLLSVMGVEAFSRIIELGALRVILFDLTVDGESYGAFTPERRAWLEGAVAVAPAKPCIVVQHQLVHPTDEESMHRHYVRESGAYRRWLAGRPEVRLIVTGHRHIGQP